MKIVLVEWVDARFSNEWVHKDNPTHIVRCTTAGVLRRENEEEIEVCLHINEESKSGCMAIPKCSITRIRRLKVDRL